MQAMAMTLKKFGGGAREGVNLGDNYRRHAARDGVNLGDNYGHRRRAHMGGMCNCKSMSVAHPIHTIYVRALNCYRHVILKCIFNKMRTRVRFRFHFLTIVL